MIPATVEICRTSGPKGAANGSFQFPVWVTPQGKTYRSLYLGAERATCHAEPCKKRGGECEHVLAARRLVASEALRIAESERAG